MHLPDLPDYLTEQDLLGLGFTRDDVARRCPGAVERTALDGSPCWALEDLSPLIDGEEVGQ
jgi:hypothetical protein